jgi:hypothetical protein
VCEVCLCLLACADVLGSSTATSFKHKLHFVLGSAETLHAEAYASHFLRLTIVT